MKLALKIGVAISCWLALASQAVAADLTLQIRDGRVTLDARNVAVREILAEWARVGETKIIVSGNRIEGPPVTLYVAGVPERDALDLVLRGMSGYIVVGRSAEASGTSAFGLIYVLPTSAAPAAARPAFPGRVVHPAADSSPAQAAPSNPSSNGPGVADAKDKRPPPPTGPGPVPGFVGSQTAIIGAATPGPPASLLETVSGGKEP